MPGVFHVIGNATVAQVNLPVAVLVWLMIVPMLLKIDLAALREVGQHWRGIASTVGVNWLIKPFSMALLAWIFIAHLFRPLLPADQIEQLHGRAHPARGGALHRHGVRLVEPRRWRAAFHASQVALNDTIMVVAFAPIVGAAAGPVLDHRAVGHAVPVGRALHRRAGDRGPALARDAVGSGGLPALAARCAALAPLSLCALLLTLVLLFGLQGEQIMRQPLVIALLAVPIIIQVYFNAGLAYWLNRRSASSGAWRGRQR